MILHAQIKKRRLTFLDSTELTEGVNLDGIEFSFDEEWRDFDKTAAFEIDGSVFTVPIDSQTNTAPIPAFPESGVVGVGVLGTFGPEQLASSVAAIRVQESLFEESGHAIKLMPDPIDPDKPNGSDKPFNPDDPDFLRFWKKVQSEIDHKQDKLDFMSTADLDRIMGV